MKIQYTRKTSGYIALGLGLFTLKVFMEALMLGRGPVPGLSFLFYAMIFYIHYVEENIEVLSILYYNRLLTVIRQVREYDWSDFALDEYRDILSVAHDNLLNAVRGFEIKRVIYAKLWVHDLLDRFQHSYPKMLDAPSSAFDILRSLINEKQIAVKKQAASRVTELRHWVGGLQGWFMIAYRGFKRNLFMLYGSLLKKYSSIIE